MTKHKLQPLNEQEKKFAEENHNLIYGFLHRYGYSIEEYYNIAVFGYLKAVQVYHNRDDLRNNFDFPYINWLYCRAEIGNHFRMENSKKRKPAEMVISLDADFMESLSGKSAESCVMDKEQLNEIMENLTTEQQKITQFKIDGYSNKDIYMSLKMPSSSYYKELQRIREIIGKLLIVNG